MEIKELTRLVMELPREVRALPKQVRNNILGSAVLDNLEESKDRLVHIKSIPENEKVPMYKDFTNAQENPEEIFEGNKAVELYGLIRSTGNYAINQDVRKHYREFSKKNHKEVQELRKFIAKGGFRA